MTLIKRLRSGDEIHEGNWSMLDEAAEVIEAQVKEIECISAAHHELNTRCDEYMVDNKRLQANLDRVMLEYCPDEMTDAQLEELAKNQKPSGFVYVQEAEIDAKNSELLSQQERLCGYVIELGRTRALCDQLGRALDGHCAPFLGHEEEHRLALEAWREMR